MQAAAGEQLCLQGSAINAAAQQREHRVLLGSPSGGAAARWEPQLLSLGRVFKGLSHHHLLQMPFGLTPGVPQVSATALKDPFHRLCLKLLWHTAVSSPGWLGAPDLFFRSSVLEAKWPRSSSSCRWRHGASCPAVSTAWCLSSSPQQRQTSLRQD